MKRKRLLGAMLPLFVAYALVGCGNSRKTEEGRAQLVQRIAEQLQAAKVKADAYDFDRANAILRDLPEDVNKSPFADVETYDKLTADIEAIRRTVSQQEADYRKRIRAGWKLIDGRFVSPAEAQARAKAEAEARAPKQRATRLPAYEVVLDDSSDTPIKTQVELRITLEKRPTESDLRGLLRSLYEEVAQRSGFKFRAHPNAVYIYAHGKMNYHENSGASWIGMVSCAVDDKEPTIRLDASRLKAQFEESSTRFGLVEEQRKKIYWELFEIEDKAQREAERKVPNPKTLEDFQRQAGEFNKLHARYLKRLLQKYKITDEQRGKIVCEGMDKNWPEPSP